MMIEVLECIVQFVKRIIIFGGMVSIKVNVEFVEIYRKRFDVL